MWTRPCYRRRIFVSPMQAAASLFSASTSHQRSYVFFSAFQGWSSFSRNSLHSWVMPVTRSLDHAGAQESLLQRRFSSECQGVLFFRQSACHTAHTRSSAALSILCFPLCNVATPARSAYSRQTRDGVGRTL